GPAPARFTPLEASLAPEACGTCHPAQLADWRTSIHAAAMGPGVAGQLAELRVRDPTTALGCQNCHAPVAVQMPLVPSPLAENRGVGHRFPTYVTPLVLLRAELVDAAGHALAGTRVERPIGREVTLDLEREVSDTRLAPGERAELVYARALEDGAVAARFSVV